MLSSNPLFDRISVDQGACEVLNLPGLLLFIVDYDATLVLNTALKWPSHNGLTWGKFPWTKSRDLHGPAEVDQPMPLSLKRSWRIEPKPLVFRCWFELQLSIQSISGSILRSTYLLHDVSMVLESSKIFSHHIISLLSWLDFMLDAAESCSCAFQPAQFKGTVPAIQEMHKAMCVCVCLTTYSFGIWVLSPQAMCIPCVFFLKLWIFGDPNIFSPTTDCLFTTDYQHHDLYQRIDGSAWFFLNLHGDWSKWKRLGMYWVCWYDDNTQYDVSWDVLGWVNFPISLLGMTIQQHQLSWFEPDLGTKHCGVRQQGRATRQEPQRFQPLGSSTGCSIVQQLKMFQR